VSRVALRREERHQVVGVSGRWQWWLQRSRRRCGWWRLLLARPLARRGASGRLQARSRGTRQREQALPKTQNTAARLLLRGLLVRVRCQVDGAIAARRAAARCRRCCARRRVEGVEQRVCKALGVVAQQPQRLVLVWRA
jgi:hypothetical protein